MSAFQSLHGSAANCPARAIGINPMQGDYVPPKTVWVRNDGNKHIKSLTTAPAPQPEQPAPPQPPVINPTTPHAMATPQIPAKPARKASRRASTDEDYSTPYKPPADPVHATKQADAPAATKAPVSYVAGVCIESGIPVPSKNASRGQAVKAQMTALVAALQPGQSAELPSARRSVLSRAIVGHKNAHNSTFVTRSNSTTKTLRVWRTA